MATRGQARAVNQITTRTQQRPKPASRQTAVQPAEGLKRRRPGTTGEGHYYHIEIRSKRNFQDFRTEDVGRKGHIQRVAGQRANGTWETVKWLIAKTDAHIEDGRLVPESRNARMVFKELASDPVHVKGDRFKTIGRQAAPKKAKPAARRQRAAKE
jgi:hypothetical protein